MRTPQTEEARELLENLTDVIRQTCYDSQMKRWDSMGMMDYAYAMRSLAQYGLLEITVDEGRRVIADWVEVDE